MRYNIGGENNQSLLYQVCFLASNMKLNPNNPDNMITPMVSLGSLSKQIKGIKNALKQPELYNDEEIRHLKRALKDLYAERTELNKGNGFGN